jgi:hypothetical protein
MKEPITRLFKGFSALLSNQIDYLFKDKTIKEVMQLTAVSSIVLSSGSTLPPGKEVSPAYVLSEADRLFGNFYKLVLVVLAVCCNLDRLPAE